MPLELMALGKAVGAKLLSAGYKLVKERLAKRQARNRALTGEDLARKGRLENLAEAELRKLHASSGLPPELQSIPFCEWLLSAGSVELFAEVLIARAGGDDTVAQRARNELTIRFEHATGETRKRAIGSLDWAVSHVVGQLNATESGKQALLSALTLRNAANLSALRHPEPLEFPTAADLSRIQTVAEQLLNVGRATWKMPAFVAPLTLEAHEEKDEKDGNGDIGGLPITPVSLVEALKAGDHVILFGEGGIGKTTFLLELASFCLRDAGQRIPLYVDAPVWARSGLGLLEFLAGTLPAQAYGVTSSELAKLAGRGFLSLLVNGWNEIPTDRKAYCHDTFNTLTSTATDLAIVVTSRTAHDVARLRSPRRIVIRGLTWRGQSDAIRSELGEAAAKAALELLVKDPRLRHAARSPLILRGLIAQAETGAKFSTSPYDLLGAVVTTFESDAQRGLMLTQAPVFGHHTRYLEALACRLNRIAATDLPLVDALASIGATARQMVGEGLLGESNQPSEILGVLASHHLLQVQDDLVRFSHQRFQEYFSAAPLLRVVTSDEPTTLLASAVNEPAWADALELVAAKLKAPNGTGVQRARLVRTAKQLDLSYACEVAGLCAFVEADDVALHALLVSCVNELAASPLGEVRELSIACAIASRLPAFADRLWTLFESDDPQIRMHSHRLNNSPVSLDQLGSSAESRISTWSPERRAELLYEIARNPDNYEFITRMALVALEPNVRIAAISALFWEFPASTNGIEAWLKAPLEVQTAPNLVWCVDESLKQGLAGEQVREQLRTIAATDIPDEARVRLALAFPAELGATAVDVALARLRNKVEESDANVLVSLARAHAPDRLRALALDLVAAEKGTPSWVGVLLLNETSDVREAAFERAWEALQAGEVKYLNFDVVGPLSGTQQTRRSFKTWLQHRVELRHKFDDATYQRVGQIEQLLARTPGEDLFVFILEIAACATYEQSVVLAQMLFMRISKEAEKTSHERWLPSIDQFSQLLELLCTKNEEEVEGPQDSLFAYLACTASYVAPVEFGAVLLEALRRQLDAWAVYRASLAEWLRNPTGTRPMNPGLGDFVVSALARWGMDALPSVTSLLSHPNALDIVPQAIRRIASQPWTAVRAGQLLNSVSTDVQEGRRRRGVGRAMKQPTDASQSATDEAAVALVRLLDAEVEREFDERDRKGSAAQVSFQVDELVCVLANLPSLEVVAPVTRTLSSGLLGKHAFVSAVRGLIRQGWIFSDANVVGECEAVYERETHSAWIDDSTRHTLAEFSQLMFLVEPSTLLTTSLGHYLSQWQRFAGSLAVMRSLGELNAEGAWPLLVTLGTELAAEGEVPEELAYALGSTLSSTNLADFAHLIASGTMFWWFGDGWTLKRISPTVAKVVEDDPELLTSLINACRSSVSPHAYAFLLDVMSNLDVDDAKRAKIGLEALDAGCAHREARSMLAGMFVRKVPMGGNMYESNPKACNELRQRLYRRARLGGKSAIAAREILASLECGRRELGRPADEPRHPEPADGLPWTSALLESHSNTTTF